MPRLSWNDLAETLEDESRDWRHEASPASTDDDPEMPDEEDFYE